MICSRLYYYRYCTTPYRTADRYRYRARTLSNFQCLPRTTGNDLSSSRHGWCSTVNILRPAWSRTWVLEHKILGDLAWLKLVDLLYVWQFVSSFVFTPFVIRLKLTLIIISRSMLIIACQTLSQVVTIASDSILPSKSLLCGWNLVIPWYTCHWSYSYRHRSRYRASTYSGYFSGELPTLPAIACVVQGAHMNAVSHTLHLHVLSKSYQFGGLVVHYIQGVSFANSASEFRLISGSSEPAIKV